MEHEIKTIEDIVKVITSENLDNFLIDFKQFLAFRLSLKDMKIPGVEIEVEDTSTFHWIDDGKHDAHIKIIATQKK